MFFLLSLLVSVIGALPIFLAGKNVAKLATFLSLVLFYTLFGCFVIWAMLPGTASPMFGSYSILVMLFWIITAITAITIDDESFLSFLPPIILLIIFFFVGISGSEMFNAEKYSSLIGQIQDKNQKHWSQDIQPLDPTHIRLVPKELAISLAKTVLTSQNGAALGSQYPLSEKYITLQKIKNDYYYLIPLDFKGFTVWTNSSGVPAYVKVSATDPYAKPLLVTDKKFKYTPEACFGDNLERHIYWKYMNKRLRDFSFEEDDNGNVYWVLTVCKPTITYWGNIIEGVVLLNPENGEEEFVSIEQLKQDKYKWIDRVYSEDVIKEYVDYWGRLKDGWWNGFWTHINLLESESPTINYSSNGECVFVSPVTSTNNSDETMTGLMYTNTKTGEFTYYTINGGATEGAVIDAVKSVVGYKEWSASEQIVYENIYGKLSALVPVLGNNGNYQGLAIVENENKRVAYGLTPQEALSEYQKIIISSGGQISTEEGKNTEVFSGKIVRIGWDMTTNGKQYYIYFNEFKNTFIINSNIQSELSLTKEGDLVKITYIKSNQAVVPAMSFVNLTLNIQTSKNEKSVQQQMVSKKDSVEKTKDVKDFKEEVKNIVQ